MRKLVLSILVILSVLCQAQDDSSFIDMGRTQVRKAFTQKITIKGKDLEKLPFSNLTEAINVWLYGFNSNASTLVFVIDGNMVTDVNQYSIHDIEEISLIQNAQVQVNGAFKQSQLVVVTTKKAKETGTAFQLNGKIHLVEKEYAYPPSPQKIKSEKNLYHQYHISAHKKTNKLNAGASFSFLRDVLPQLQNQMKITLIPDQLNRYRLNSFMDLGLGRSHVLSARFNIARQNNSFEETMGGGTGASSYSDRYSNYFNLNGELGLKSMFSNGLTNQMSLAYTGFNQDFINYYSYTGTPAFIFNGGSESTTNNFLARNTFRYHNKTGNWNFSPAVNLSFRHIREHYFDITRLRAGGNPEEVQQNWRSGRANQFLLTPSLDISYQQVFNLNGGFVKSFSNNKQEKIFPYVSTSLNVLGLFQKNSQHSWHVFGSYSSAGYFFDQSYFMPDLSNTNPGAIHLYGYLSSFDQVQPNSTMSNKQAGTRLSFLNNKIQLSYHFEDRDFVALLYIPIPNGGNSTTIIPIFPDANSFTHRFQLTFKPLNNDQTSWITNIHLNNIKTDISNISMYASNDVTGDIFTNERSWTGGWNNRFNFKNLSAGFDIATHLNREVRIGYDVANEGLFTLQHVFIGYTLNNKRLKNAEVFISAKNIAMNEWHAYQVEPRRYYGVGFRIMN